MCLKGEPPLVLSNAYPGDLLPRPLVAMEKIAENQILDPIDALKRSKRGKALKDLRYVTVAQFDKLRKGRGFEMEKIEAIDPMVTEDIFHNTVDRLLGTTGEGGLYVEEETFPNASAYPYLSLYVWCKPNWRSKLLNLLVFVGKEGFGKRRSIGKGQFEVMPPDDVSRIFELDKPNAFVSLSDFIPAKDDPTDGTFRTFTKYGKLGGEYAASGQPFKRPLLMIAAGAVFKAEHVKPFYGKALESVAKVDSHIIHPAFALAVPAKI
jgi:CRISPR-associated protein Csm4